MIGLLRGIILQKQAPELLLEVAGVGYELLASLTTFIDLPEINEEVTLYTHLIVREDAHTLFAFSSLEERVLFRLLLKVNGVGPKMALAIVSGMTTNEFSQRVHSNDVAGLTKLPGVGKKTAERLIIEMRDRLPQPTEQSGIDSKSPPQTIVRNLEDEAIAALLALGYKPTQASQMIAKYSSDGLSVEEIVRKALKASLG